MPNPRFILPFVNPETLEDYFIPHDNKQSHNRIPPWSALRFNYLSFN